LSKLFFALPGFTLVDAGGFAKVVLFILPQVNVRADVASQEVDEVQGRVD